MMIRILSFLLVCGIFTTLFPIQTFASDFNPHFLISDSEMIDTFAMTQSELQSFLENRGSLGNRSFRDINDRVRSASEIIWNTAQKFDINPQFLLVLLQREQSLITDPNPSQKQLDWAMGYAICDSCSMNDPGVQKYRGFAEQVYYAAKRIRESYLADLDMNGKTISGMGPEITKSIDNTSVTPTNNATAVLYTYTPHLHGNQNFVAIWHRWFVRNYPTGSLLQDNITGEKWLIQFGDKRLITSQTAFLTRYDPNRVIFVKPTVLEAYNKGSSISFPNYSLLRSPKGTVFLLVDDTIRGIESMEAFRKIGFNTDEIIDVTFEDLEPFTRGPIISLETVFPQGILLQDKTTGGVWFVEDGIKHPIPSKEILKSRFPNWPVNPVDPQELDGYEIGESARFTDGTLVAAHGSPDIFVIEEGKRRLIDNEEAFHVYGWDFANVIWTSEKSVLLHELIEPITLELQENEIAELLISI
jgi:hypothetical protein